MPVDAIPAPMHLTLGAVAALGAACCWAISTILWTRQMAVSWPQAMNLFKTGLCLPLFVGTLLIAGPHPAFGGVTPGAAAILLASGVIGMSLGDSAYFAGLGRIGARRTMMLQCLTPLFAAVIALCFGDGLPGLLTSVGVAMVVIGIVLVLRERPVGTIVRGHVGQGIFFATASAFCQALGIILTKRGLANAGILQASAIRIFAGVIGILLFEALRGQLIATVRHTVRPPSLPRIIPAALLGSFVGFLLFQIAIRHSSPAVAAALTGTSPLFVAPLSVAFLGEAMAAGGWIGTILAVAGVALVMLAR
jgi:drug/metabolite transporter (DMT)-like permease